MKDACGFKPVACGRSSCEAKYARRDAASHADICPKATIFCSRGGNKCATFLRDNSELHTLKSYRFLQCGNARLGCETVGTRVLLDSHQQYCKGLIEANNEINRVI